MNDIIYSNPIINLKTVVHGGERKENSVLEQCVFVCVTQRQTEDWSCNTQSVCM